MTIALPQTKTSLSDRLRDLGLLYCADNLDDIVARATQKRWSITQTLEYLVDLELSDKQKRSLERRLKNSQMGSFKLMTDFDWAWPSQIDRAKVECALRLDFLPAAGNVILVANQGLGKTMIAKNIAYQAAIAGHSVRFISSSSLLLDLAAQDSARALDRRLNYWASLKLLVIDEIGYLSYDNRNADLLFQIVSRRYEKRSLVLTTNLAFKDWPSIFPNAACTTALIDRVIHHSIIIPITGDSYRKRDADVAAKASLKQTRK